jgi:hypothetical protein
MSASENFVACGKSLLLLKITVPPRHRFGTGLLRQVVPMTGPDTT